MKRILAAVAIAACAAVASLTLAHPALAQASLSKVKVGIPYPGNDSLPMYVASEKGFFTEEKLAVELIVLATGDKIAVAVLGGAVEIGCYTPDWFVRAIEKGGSDLKLVLGPGSDLIFSMMVLDSIRDYADLKGKRVGVSTLKAADAYLVKKMFADHGLKETDIVLIPAGSSPERAAALRAGSLSATLITPPIDQRIIDEGGFKRIDLSTNSVKHYLWGSQTVSSKWASANRPVLVAYMRAWMKGMRWIYDESNADELVKMMTRHMKVDEAQARSLYKLYFGPGVDRKDGSIDMAGLQEVLNVLAGQGEIDPPLPSPAKYPSLSIAPIRCT